MSSPITFVEVTPEREFPILVTDIIDLGLRSLKTLTSVEVGTVSEDVQVAIDYRYKAKEEFSTTPYKKLSGIGIVTFPITAMEFRIRLKWRNQDDIDISYITVRWKLSDKRVVRGTYALSNRTISGTGE